jgi:hypothetical protein
LIRVRGSKFDVHEVPLAGLRVMLAVAVAVGIPISVCPRRLAGDVVGGQIVGICGEHRCDLFPHSRIEGPLGDEGNDLVAFVSPCGSRSRAECDKAGDECECEYELAGGRQNAKNCHRRSSLLTSRPWDPFRERRWGHRDDEEPKRR